MSCTLVTGASGFIGSRVVPMLLERGDEVIAAVRPGSSTTRLGALDVRRAEVDVRDRAAVREAMHGIDRVFHVAGVATLNGSLAQTFQVNVNGSRIVFEEALRAGVQRVVYTSSIAAVGPARPGELADETNVWDAGRYRIPYLDSKLEAEVVALRMVRQGLPLVTVNPTWVMGAGGWGSDSTAIVRRFLQGRLPGYVNGTLNIVSVDDVARGLVLADQYGQSGQRYILGNRNLSIQSLFGDIGRLAGVRPPSVRFPVPVALLGAAAARRVPRLSDLPSPLEVRAASLNWAAVNTKAKRVLGWTTSPHEECLRDVIHSLRSESPDAPGERRW
jgi:dihydroflavonol-4-reductase